MSAYLVALLITVVLGDEVEVLATDDDGALHLGRHDLTSEDAATDGNIAGERALLVNVVSLDGLLGGLEAQTNLLVPAVVLDGLLASDLGVLEDTLLLLESLLNLFCVAYMNNRRICKLDLVSTQYTLVGMREWLYS